MEYTIEIRRIGDFQSSIVVFVPGRDEPKWGCSFDHGSFWRVWRMMCHAIQLEEGKNGSAA